jgi:hypothetical protein
MTKLEELEKSIAALPKAELDQFADWFDALRASQWDNQIEIDASGLALNSLASLAISSHRNGTTTAL